VSAFIPPPGPLRIRALRVVLIAALLQATFVFFFVFPSHDPEPNGLQVAVVGAGPAAAGVEGRLAQGGFEVVRAPSEAAAAEGVRDREAYGALVLGGRGVERVLVAPAASVPAAQILEGIGRQAGAGEVREVAPLPAGDARGVTLNLLVLPLVVTAIISALVAISLVPEIDLRGRILLAAAGGALGGSAAIGIVKALDALDGPFLALAGVAALGVIAIALTAAGLIRLIGPAGTAVPFLLFLMLGTPAAGLGSAPALLPTPWLELGQLMPPGAVGSALRGTAYFDGAGVLGPVVVLLAWVGVGVALNAIAGRRAPARAAVPVRAAGVQAVPAG